MVGGSQWAARQFAAWSCLAAESPSKTCIENIDNENIGIEL